MKFNVFISSTISDMRDLRNEIKVQLGKMKKINPILSEYPDTFPKPISPELTTFEASINPIKYCHIFVLIINKRYGNVNPGEDISITESENEEAVDNFIPRILFIEEKVISDYENWNKIRSPRERNNYISLLEGYDNPKKTMNFVKKLLKIKTNTISNYNDNWRWTFNIDNKKQFLLNLKSLLSKYMTEIKEKKKMRKK